MSARAQVSAAAGGMRRLAKNLQKVADGSVVEQVLGRVRAQLAGIVRDKTARHRESGYAASNSTVNGDASGIDVSFPKYLDFNPKWWPFAKGLPLFVVRNVAKLLRAAVTATIGGDPGGTDYFAGLDALAADRAAKRAARTAARKAERAAMREKRREIRAQGRAAAKEIRASGRAFARTGRKIERLRQRLAA